MLGSEDTTKEVAYSLRVEEWKSVGNSESWGKSMSAGVEQDKGRESWKDSGHSDETEKKLAKMDYIEQGRELYEIRIRWRPRFRSGNKGHGLDFISRAQRNQGGVLSKRMAWHFYFIKITPALSLLLLPVPGLSPSSALIHGSGSGFLCVFRGSSGWADQRRAPSALSSSTREARRRCSINMCSIWISEKLNLDISLASCNLQ